MSEISRVAVLLLQEDASGRFSWSIKSSSSTMIIITTIIVVVLSMLHLLSSLHMLTKHFESQETQAWYKIEDNEPSEDVCLPCGKVAKSFSTEIPGGMSAIKHAYSHEPSFPGRFDGARCVLLGTAEVRPQEVVGECRYGCRLLIWKVFVE